MFRTTVTVLCVMVMIGTLVATQIFTQGVGYSLQLGTDRLGGDLMVVPVGHRTRLNPTSSLDSPKPST